RARAAATKGIAGAAGVRPRAFWKVAPPGRWGGRLLARFASVNLHRVARFGAARLLSRERAPYYGGRGREGRAMSRDFGERGEGGVARQMRLRPSMTLAGRTLSSFHVCGVSGLVAAIATALALSARLGLSV